MRDPAIGLSGARAIAALLVAACAVLPGQHGVELSALRAVAPDNPSAAAPDPLPPAPSGLYLEPPSASRIVLLLDVGWSAERAMRTLLRSWETGDTGGFPELFTEDAIYDDMPNARRLTGLEEITGYVAGVHSWADSVTMEIGNVRAAEDFAFAEWVFRAVQTGPMGSMVRAVTCRRVEIPGITVITMRDGRIARAVDYIQVLPLILQVGGRVEIPGGTVLELPPGSGEGDGRSDCELVGSEEVP